MTYVHDELPRQESAMEKDWSEYVEKTRAEARAAAAKWNGEGRCHETGIEDMDARGYLGPNMTEMNGPEPAPLKVGSLPLPKLPMQELLEERGQTHGEYTLHSLITQEIKAVFRKYGYLTKLRPDQRETFDMTAHKQGRILAGNPDHPDHWRDIAGYNELSAERCG